MATCSFVFVSLIYVIKVTTLLKLLESFLCKPLDVSTSNWEFSGGDNLFFWWEICLRVRNINLDDCCMIIRSQIFTYVRRHVVIFRWSMSSYSELEHDGLQHTLNGRSKTTKTARNLPLTSSLTSASSFWTLQSCRRRRLLRLRSLCYHENLTIGL